MTSNPFTRIHRAYLRSFTGLPSNAWWLALAFFVYRSGTMVLPFFMLYLTTQLGFSHTTAGRFMALYGVGSIAGSLLGGRLIGSIGARHVLIVSYFLTGIALLALALPRDPYYVACVVLIFSLVAEIGRPATAAAATEMCPEAYHTKALALNRLAVNLGMTFGPAVGGFLTEISYTWLFVVDAVTCWLAAALLMWRFGRLSEERSTRMAEYHVDGQIPCRNPWTDPQFLVLAALTSTQAIIFFQLLGTYPMYLKEVFQFSEREIGLVFALNTVCVVLFEMVLMDWIAKFQQVNVMAWGNFLICLGFGLLPLGSGWAITSLSVLVWTLGEMLTMPVMAAYVSRMARNPVERGRYFGAYTSCYSLAFVLAPIIGTALYEFHQQAMCWLSLAMGPLLLMAFLRLGKRSTDLLRHNATISDVPQGSQCAE